MKELAGTGIPAVHTGIDPSIGTAAIECAAAVAPHEAISPLYWERDQAERVFNL
ncbi:hypothetical protein [Streptomyces sp. NPDC055134]